MHQTTEIELIRQVASLVDRICERFGKIGSYDPHPAADGIVGVPPSGPCTWAGFVTEDGRPNYVQMHKNTGDKRQLIFIDLPLFGLADAAVIRDEIFDGKSAARTMRALQEFERALIARGV